MVRGSTFGVHFVVFFKINFQSILDVFFEIDFFRVWTVFGFNSMPKAVRKGSKIEQKAIPERLCAMC